MLLGSTEARADAPPVSSCLVNAVGTNMLTKNSPILLGGLCLKHFIPAVVIIA